MEIREHTLKSTAPSLIYEEGNLIKRSIRDLYARDIDEVIVGTRHYDRAQLRDDATLRWDGTAYRPAYGRWGFTFDPARPTSLLYRKTKDGYELIGAMYTAPRSVSLEELDERIPLGVARWHQHTNLCMPKRGQAPHADWTRFGLTGSISTEEECQEAGGRFYPVIFGWMVHVYPFESSLAKVWAQ